MAKNQQSDVSSPAHYSTINSAWNNIAVGPSCSLLNDSEKVDDSDWRQTKTAQVNLNKSKPQVNPIPIEKEEAFDLIIKAREYIKNWNVPSPASMRQYNAAAKRLQKHEQLPEDYAHTKRGFYYYRAALVAQILSEMKNKLITINRLQKKNDLEWLVASHSLSPLLTILKRYPPDQEKTHLEEKIKSKWHPSEKTSRSTAKRRGVGTLPSNWRTHFWKSFPEKSPHRHALAILSATGCRPSELANGVKIELDEQGDLHFFITGSKTHNGIYGQQFRQLTIKPDDEDALFLLKCAEKNAGTLTVFIKSPKALSETIRRHSKKLWPKRKYVVSPYSFRHQLAADLKNDFSPAEVAMALGHCVCKTQKYYGQRNQGRSGTQLLGIKAEKEPRPENTINSLVTRNKSVIPDVIPP